MKTSQKRRQLLIASVVMILLGCCSAEWRLGNLRETLAIGQDQLVTPRALQARQYGWNQLNAILTPNGAEATWETWSSKCNLADDIAAAHPSWRMNLTGDCASLHHATFRDATLRGALETAAMTPQAAGDAFRPASVFFNGVAVKSINDNKWNLPTIGGSTTDPLIPGAEIPPQVTFYSGSVIVKAIWEVVNSEGSNWPLRVYDYGQRQWKQGTGISPPQSLALVESTTPGSGWKTLVHVNVNEKTPCPYKGGSAPSDIPLNSTVPISCFVHHRITRQMYDVSMLGNTAGHWQGTYPFYLVLVGLNVSTRDDHGWKFTTFWWTNDPGADPIHTSTPPGNLPFRYTQFAMDTSDASYPVQNPYLEGPEGRTGMNSDCADCHKLAEVRVDQMTGGVIRTQSNFGLPDQLSALPSDYDQGRILTDSVWTLATARDGGTVTMVMAHRLHYEKSGTTAQRHDQFKK